MCGVGKGWVNLQKIMFISASQVEKLFWMNCFTTFHIINVTRFSRVLYYYSSLSSYFYPLGLPIPKTHLSMTSVNLPLQNIILRKNFNVTLIWERKYEVLQQYHVVPLPLGSVRGCRANWAVHGSMHGCLVVLVLGVVGCILLGLLWIQ